MGDNINYKTPLDFYIAEKQRYVDELKVVDKKLLGLSIVRLSVFISTAFLFYHLFNTTETALIVLVLGISFFLFLVKRYDTLKKDNTKLRALISINETEITVINKNASALNKGVEFISPDHKYSFDIELFGNGSFFQYINRTATQSGKDLLAKTMTSNDINNILKKQNAVDELSNKPIWRQDFSATASIVTIELKTDTISDWMKNYKPVIPKMMFYISTAFTFFSVLLLFLVYIKIHASIYILLWFLFGLTISGSYFNKVTKISHLSSLAKNTFSQYFKLLEHIENSTFSSDILIQQKERIIDKEKASKVFKQFSKTIDRLDQRDNLLFGVFANGFTLWDLNYANKIESWIATYSKKVDSWFEVIAFFDAQNSLANYRFNHPNHVYPTLTNKSMIIKSKQLGHPLIDTKNRIDNNFDIKEQSFYIITGANMAGKSTFLRTVSLSIVMANMGLPVCAKSYSYSPIKLITSMRTNDSLAKNESYFFSELKRLKFIKEAIEQDSYFIVLDEILKGTNSTDKAIGSRKFIKKLVASNSTGIIATHDLSLCEISEELKEVENYYFNAEIISDKLVFDYTLKEGICQNMNASFLLNKMGIV